MGCIVSTHRFTYHMFADCVGPVHTQRSLPSTIRITPPGFSHVRMHTICLSWKKAISNMHTNRSSRHRTHTWSTWPSWAARQDRPGPRTVPGRRRHYLLAGSSSGGAKGVPQYTHTATTAVAHRSRQKESETQPRQADVQRKIQPAERTRGTANHSSILVLSYREFRVGQLTLFTVLAPHSQP